MPSDFKSRQRLNPSKMRTVIFSFIALVVITPVFTSNDSVPLVKASIEALKAIGMIPIFLRFSGSSSSELYPWIEDTQISSLVVRDMCLETAVDPRVTTEHCDHVFEKIIEIFYLKNIVFLVPSRPKAVLSVLQKLIPSSYVVPILVIVSPGEQLPVAPKSCFLTWINATAIDAPDDTCLHTGNRKKIRGFSADIFHVQDKLLYPKNINVAFSVHGNHATNWNNYIHCTEAVAYMQTLSVLNVTSIKNNIADIIMEPSTISLENLKTYDIGAVYTCYGQAFFGSSVTSNKFHVISWSSLMVLVTGLIFIGGVIITSFWLTKNRFPHSSCRISGILLFLVASAVGRSPVSLNVICFSYRALLLLWLFGTFIIGAYVQTQITSEYNVPAYLPTVQTLEELETLTSSGRILPCVELSNLPSFHVISSDSRKGTIENLYKIIIRNLKSCTSVSGECYMRARDKTHVYIAPADFRTRKLAQIWGLESGREVLLTCCSASLARKGFRYIHQHRRLVRLLAEVGLTLYEERRETWNHNRKSLRTVTFPFSMQFQVLIYGITGSCFVFICELLFSKMI